MVYSIFVSIFNVCGKYEILIEYYEKVLEIRKEVKDREGEGIMYVNFGNVYYVFG